MAQFHDLDLNSLQCSCGHPCNETQAFLFDPEKGNQMAQLWHVFHRVELGFDYSFEAITSDKSCAACRAPTTAYRLSSGASHVDLCESSAKEYAIIMSHQFTIPLAAPFTCDCKGCVALAEQTA
jgi:hypothetical protein